VLAQELNPALKYYDPLRLASWNLWETGDEATIGFLRHAEIKHGRVAMFAFVGYVVQSNVHWPWPMSLDGTPFPSTDLSPPEQWASLPIESKHQIISFIGLLEVYSELASSLTTDEYQAHYMKGGQPGKFPNFGSAIPHPVPFNLFDPFGFSKNRSAEAKANGLVKEINNGRLAMLGLFGFLTEQTIPGSVPLLSAIVKPYEGALIAGKEFTFF
jgi:light-harvesting complex I chlorophyll a/b binding protein 3